MERLKTTYLGMELKNPIIVGSSPLTSSVDKMKKCEDAGAGAVVSTTSTSPPPSSSG